MNYHWREALSDALRRNRRDAHHRYLQLATLGADGWPANRTVVFRGFSADGLRLQVATDTRSDKVGQLKERHEVEICWYFTRSREQFRIRGKAVLHDDSSTESEAREQLWSSMSDAARAQFFWRDPGQPLGEGEELAQTAEGSAAPSSFLLLEIEPLAVDHLKLSADPQERYLSRLDDDSWQATAVNP